MQVPVSFQLGLRPQSVCGADIDSVMVPASPPRPAGGRAHSSNVRPDGDATHPHGINALAAHLRAQMLDQIVEGFLSTFAGATVIELRSGPSNRFDRVDNGTVQWFDIDGHDTIESIETASRSPLRRTRIVSRLDGLWLEKVRATDGPWLFIVEHSPTTHRQDDVRRLFRTIAEHFPGALLAFGSVDRPAPSSRTDGNATRLRDRGSEHQWFCPEPRDVECWHPHLFLAESRTVLDAHPEIINAQPWFRRWLLRAARWLPGRPMRALHYTRVNLFRVSWVRPS